MSNIDNFKKRLKSKLEEKLVFSPYRFFHDLVEDYFLAFEEVFERKGLEVDYEHAFTEEGDCKLQERLLTKLSVNWVGRDNGDKPRPRIAFDINTDSLSARIRSQGDEKFVSTGEVSVADNSLEELENFVKEALVKFAEEIKEAT